MKPASGFLSSDNKFFHLEEECRVYEAKLQCEARRKTVINYFSQGEFASDGPTSLPRNLHDHIAALSEGDLLELWNEHLLPLFFVEQVALAHSVLQEIPDTGSSRETTDPVEFFALKLETAYKLLAFVMGESP